MARYQYAKDQLGQVVRAIDLIGKEQQSDFICLGCDNILIAKVNGKIKKNGRIRMQKEKEHMMKMEID